uniref:Uncharacterized protein n=1 Tax=Oryzias latipes TaxID=8090 RepID=A0A3B3IDF4_ORYLA
MSCPAFLVSCLLKHPAYRVYQSLNCVTWTEDKANNTHLSGRLCRTTKSRDCLFESLSKASPEDNKSAFSQVSAEEEELMYLEFISAVTKDILSRGHISNRVIDHVMKRHIEMNLHKLDEDKKHHLLEVLHKEGLLAQKKSAEENNSRLKKKIRQLQEEHKEVIEIRGEVGAQSKALDALNAEEKELEEAYNSRRWLEGI